MGSGCAAHRPPLAAGPRQARPLTDPGTGEWPKWQSRLRPPHVRSGHKDRLHEQPALPLCVFLHPWRELRYAWMKVQPQLRELLAVLRQENSMTLSVAVDVVVEAVMVAVVVVQQ